MEDFMQNVSTTRRPLGITIIAILLFISAVIEIIFGLFAFIGTTLASPLAGLLLGWIPLALSHIHCSLGIVDTQTMGVLGHIDSGDCQYCDLPAGRWQCS